AGQLLTDRACVVARLDGEIASEQLDDRVIGRGLAIRCRGGLDDEAAAAPVRMRELPQQSRLADTRLADNGHHLPAAAAGNVTGVMQLSDLRGAANEACEPPRDRRRLQPGTDSPAAEQLEHL